MMYLRKFREAKGLSQATVANDLGISRQTYNNYELGKRQADYEALLKIAEYFDTTVENLLTGKDNSISNLIYSRLTELCDINNISLDTLEEKTGVNVIKTIEGYNKKSVSKETIKNLTTLALYLGVITSYLWGYPDDLEMAKRMAGTEIIGEIHRVSKEYKNQRVVDLADKLDYMNDEDRNYYLDIFEKILAKYYSMLEQINRE